MLKIFKSSFPSRLILLLLIGVGLAVLSFFTTKSVDLNYHRILLSSEKVSEGFFMYDTIYDYTGLIPVYINTLQVYFGTGFIQVIATILILVNAVYFNSIIDQYRLIEQRTFLPALFCIFLSFSFYQDLSLSPILIGSMFVTLSMSSLMKVGLEGSDKTYKAFVSGIYLGLAFLCDQIFILYLLLAAVALQYYYSKGGKAYLELIKGWSFPIVLVLIFYLYVGTEKDFINYYFFSYLKGYGNHSIPIKFYFPAVILTILLLLLYFARRLQMSFKNYVAKGHQLLVIWFLISILAIFLMKDRYLSGAYLMVNPVAFFITFYVLHLRREWIGELVLIILIIFSVGFNFFREYNPSLTNEIVKKNTLSHQEKKYDGKVLTLTNNPNLYADNDLGSAFVNWELHKRTFLNLSKGNNLEKIYLGITADFPKYIIDPDGIFDRVVEEIPLLNQKYKKLDDKTYRLN